MLNYPQSLPNGYTAESIRRQPDAQMIEKYAPLVKHIAGRIAAGLPSQVELDDLVSYGILGLADALLRFEGNRGAKFETYASVRIRGAIIDGLRRMDWIPHGVRAKARQLQRCIAELESQLRRSPEASEVAGYMGITLQEYRARLDEVKIINLVSLEDCISGEQEGDLRLIDLLDDPKASLCFDEVEKEEVQQILATAIEKLPDKEKMVVSLYYYEELTLKEIAEVLSISESRVSQLHTHGILRLRGALSRSKKRLF